MQQSASAADYRSMQIIRLTDGRVVVARVNDIYRPDETGFTLGYRRLLGVIRFAQVLEDQLGVPPERAAVLAASALGVGADA